MATASSIKLTQAERTALSDKRILAAAERLIARQGSSRTTLAQIGKEAGYTGGLVSHRFGSKDALLARVVEHIIGRAADDQLSPATEGLRGLDQLTALCSAYLGGLEARAERTRALFILMFESLGPAPGLRPYFVEYTENFRRLIEATLREGQSAGDVPADLGARTEAIAIVGLLRGIAMQWLTEPEAFDMEVVRRHVEARLRAGR